MGISFCFMNTPAIRSGHCRALLMKFGRRVSPSRPSRRCSAAHPQAPQLRLWWPHPHRQQRLNLKRHLQPLPSPVWRPPPIGPCRTLKTSLLQESQSLLKQQSVRSASNLLRSILLNLWRNPQQRRKRDRAALRKQLFRPIQKHLFQH